MTKEQVIQQLMNELGWTEEDLREEFDGASEDEIIAALTAEKEYRQMVIRLGCF